MTYDRSAICRRAHALRREGLDMPSAMKAAWAEAKASRQALRQAQDHALPAAPIPQPQPGGFAAALRRHGIDASALVARARQAVQAAVRWLKAEDTPRLPAPARLRVPDAIEARRQADGSYTA